MVTRQWRGREPVRKWPLDRTYWASNPLTRKDGPTRTRDAHPRTVILIHQGRKSHPLPLSQNSTFGIRCLHPGGVSCVTKVQSLHPSGREPELFCPRLSIPISSRELALVKSADARCRTSRPLALTGGWPHVGVKGKDLIAGGEEELPTLCIISTITLRCLPGSLSRRVNGVNARSPAGRLLPPMGPARENQAILAGTTRYCTLPDMTVRLGRYEDKRLFGPSWTVRQRQNEAYLLLAREGRVPGKMARAAGKERRSRSLISEKELTELSRSRPLPIGLRARHAHSSGRIAISSNRCC